MSDDELVAVDAAIRRAGRCVGEVLHDRLDLVAGLAAVKNRSQRSDEEGRAPFTPLGLAQDVLVRIQPAGLPLLPSYMDGPPALRSPRRKLRWSALAGWRSGGQSDVVIQMAPVVAAVVQEVVRYFTAEALDTLAGRWRERVRGRSEKVRQIVRKTAREAGLSEERLEDLADAVVDALDDSTD